VAILLLVLVLIFIWNRLLQRVIDRKSRQLLREHTAHIKAALRAEERTHLAVELHDSLSQNLSGVACQIAATKGTLPDGAEATARHLSTAERMLLSCRTELRRCLWDLRENALSEKDFADAVRKTLDPVVVGASVHVDLEVPRALLDETTAHSVLCIIRELASNAVRHGKAGNIKVSGELRERSIVFSVDDDGCGFAPGEAAGADEGHFGLDGIRERIKRLDGAFSISSEPGKGCKATATIPLTTNN
jgi:signal transduction histidine kinase